MSNNGTPAPVPLTQTELDAYVASRIKAMWTHRILIACGAIMVVCSAVVPVIAPVLGPTGVKLMAAAGLAMAVAGNVQKALGPKPTPPPVDDLTPRERPMR